MNQTYWADDEVKKVTGEMTQQAKNWGAQASQSSVFSSVVNTWRRNLLAYYSTIVEPTSWQSSLGYGGEQGELVKMCIPISKTLIKQLVSLVTRQRIYVEALAETTDAKTMRTTRLAKSIANQDIEEHNLNRKFLKVVESNYIVGAGYITCTWRNDMGNTFSRDDQGNIDYTGSNCYEVVDIRDYIYDWNIPNIEDRDWGLIRRQRNRWSILAQYPDLRNKILAAPSVQESRDMMYDLNYISMYQNSDMINVYEFYHKITPALPKGRMVQFLEDQTVLFDDENLYECIPIEEMRTDDIMGTGLGDPLLSSLLPCQEMIDNSYSAQATNQSAFAVQNVLVPDGCDLSVMDISSSMKFLRFKPQNAEGGGKPEPLNLTQTPPEVASFAKECERMAESLSMLNAAVRGNPPPGVTAGTAIATLSSNAQEFLTSASLAYILCVEKILMKGIKNYQKFAKIPRIVNIVGESNAYYVQEFVGGDINAIQRIRIRTQNPLMNSVSGRSQIADNLLQAGMMKNPQEYYSVLEGAPIESTFKSELSENVAVQAEIDAVLQGKEVIPYMTDNHPLFIMGLKELTYDPVVRSNSELATKVQELIEEHWRLELQCPPELKLMLRTGQTPPAMQGPQGAPQGQPGGGAGRPKNPNQGKIEEQSDTLGPKQPTAAVADPATAPATV